MKLRPILASFLMASRRRRTSRRNRPRPHTSRRLGQESGYAFLFVLGLILLMIAGSLVAMQKGATIRRRQMEQETIWRGNQYARAVRLYYHKTGHYPQTLDDLEKGAPDLHFLRQPFKNPTNPADGSWRFIYVNAAGQIIGSTRYATLQQMALMDANGGVLPTMIGQPGQPGQPGVPVSTLADSSSASQAPTPAQVAAQGNPNGATSGGASPGNNGPDVSPNPSPDGQEPPPPTGQTSPDAPGPQNLQNPPATPPGANNIGNPQALAGLAQAGLAVNPATLAAMAMLKPTGPVDGPVLGGFLTGVACTQDTSSLKYYHGGKKYINWEFIWNPLEDAAAAMQQQMGAANGATSGSLGLPIANPFGGGPTANPNGNSGANPNGNTPPQQNPHDKTTSFRNNLRSSNYNCGVAVAVEFVNRAAARFILRSRGAGSKGSGGLQTASRCLCFFASISHRRKSRGTSQRSLILN